jgi:hypothetical protein
MVCFVHKTDLKLTTADGRHKLLWRILCDDHVSDMRTTAAFEKQQIKPQFHGARAALIQIRCSLNREIYRQSGHVGQTARH